MTEFRYEKKKVSILIPVYNRELLLEECIESTLNQTYDNFEVVIVDNASTDRTWEVCQAWAMRDERIRIFRNDENLGPVRNWQRCLDEATGEFCKFLFSDDKLMPDCLDRMVKVMTTSNCGVVVSSVLVGTSEKTATTYYKQQHLRSISHPEYLNDVLVDGSLPVSPGATLLRTELARTTLKTDFPTRTKRRYASHGAGPDLMLILSSINSSVAIAIDEPLSFFRAHPDSLTLSKMKTEVSDSYRSVIAWVLQSEYSKKQRDRYIALEWLRQIKLQRKFISLTTFSKEYEGKGGLFENATLLIEVCRHMLHKILRQPTPSVLTSNGSSDLKIERH